VSLYKSKSINDGALLLAFGMFVAGLVSLLVVPDARLLLNDPMNAYKSKTIVAHFQFIFSMAVIALSLVIAAKGRISAYIRPIFNPAFAGVKYIVSYMDRFSGGWRLPVLLLPFVIFDALAITFISNQSPWLTPDSIEFLGFAPWRTFGYPLLLRSLGLWFPHLVWIVLLQYVATLGVILVYAEAVNRMFNSPVIGFLIGFTLLTSWPFLFYSFALLADQMFFIFLTAHFASLCFAAKLPTRSAFLSAGVFAGLAIIFKPAGLFLLFAMPLLLISFRHRIRAVIGYLFLPYFIGLAGLLGVNYSINSDFTLTSLGGVTTSVNSYLLLRENTTAEPSELAVNMAKAGARHRNAYAKLNSAATRSDYFRDHVTDLNTQAVRATLKYLKNRDGLEASDRTTANKIMNYFGERSLLNRRYNEFVDTEFRQMPWFEGTQYWSQVNRTLKNIAIGAILENKTGWLKMSWRKFYSGWFEVIPFFSMRRNLGPNDYLAGDVSSGLKKGRQEEGWWYGAISKYWVYAFDLIASVMFFVSVILPLPLIILGVIVVLIIGVVGALFRHNQLNPILGVVTYSALCLILYHLEMSLVQIHFPRLLTAGMPMAALLLYSVFKLNQLIRNYEN